MGMDQWRSENGSGGPFGADLESQASRRKQADSRKTGWRKHDASVIGVLFWRHWWSVVRRSSIFSLKTIKLSIKHPVRSRPILLHHRISASDLWEGNEQGYGRIRRQMSFAWATELICYFLIALLKKIQEVDWMNKLILSLHVWVCACVW